MNWNDMPAEKVKHDIANYIEMFLTTNDYIPSHDTTAPVAMRNYDKPLSKCPFFLDHYTFV